MLEVRQIPRQQHGIMRQADGGDLEVHGAGAWVHAFQTVKNGRCLGIKREDIKVVKCEDGFLETRVAGDLIPACLAAINQSQPQLPEP